MKAIRIHEYGHADVLRYEDVDIPSISEDDLLIRVVATSVNPVDWKIRESWLKEIVPHRLPLTLGWDVSGIVEAVGKQVAYFKVGDIVYSRPDLSQNGCYAEYVAVRASEVAPRPTTVSHIEAASLPLTGITAWESIITVGQIDSGQRVLIHAASGGVGCLAVQLAKWRGAHVIATTSASNRRMVESLGADEVIDYRSASFKEIVRHVDLVFDTIGGQVQEDSWSVLKPGGILVSIVSPPSAERANRYGVRSGFVFIQPNAEILRQLAALVEAGTIRPIIGAEFALKHARKAHELSQSGRATGKIVLYVGQP